MALDNNTNLWVADTGNEVICMVSNSVVTVMAGVPGQIGTNDATVATNAHFNQPSGLLWNTANNSLLISDSGNGAIRSLFLSNSVYAVQTIAGITGQPGNVDGSLGIAKFGFPVGICVDTIDSGFYVADSGNNSVRVLQPSAPQPAVPTPRIGYVTFPATANPAYSSVFIPSTGATFNNLTNIVISAEAGTQTYVSYGPTSSTVPQPGPGSTQPVIYPGDGSSTGLVANSALVFGAGTNDVTIYAIGEAPGRRSSAVASARFQFNTANPIITGNNAASILLTDATVGATLYYTTNNTTPTNDGSDLGVASGTTLSLDITTNINLEVRAFAAGLAASQVVSNQFSISNLVGNQLTWGFPSGLASSHLITGLNMSFDAPVTFIPLAGSLPVYTLQFDLTLTNNGGAAPPALSAANFTSNLLQTTNPPYYYPLTNGIFDALTGVTGVGLSGTQPDSLELAWLVTPPITNLYQSPSLLYYSGVDETLLILGSPPGALVGELKFIIPGNTNLVGTPYTLQIGYPSASTFNDPLCCGPPINVFVQAPTNGPTTGTGLNAVKLITVLPNNSPASAHLVGDVFPFNWYNITDFGDYLLQDDDVIQTMEYAFQFGGTPYPTNSPYFDAMDSGRGTVNNFYTASDSAIDLITNGDGYIMVDDVYVTLRRSLDPTLLNFERYWSGSNWVPTNYSVPVQLSAKSSSPSPHPREDGSQRPRVTSPSLPIKFNPAAT